ncbi:MAG: 2Fe-2S iron-sulfur cluster-binding protein [Treponema sp.]|nr:2Fe-2S iron-sulfur cluster-binding protein [Treponema sp.]
MSHKPDPNKNVNLIIDGKPVTVPEGTSILDAAKTVNINIPVLCDHPDLHERALCRICVVECDGRGKLIAACANDVWEGVNIVTINKRLVNIRRTIIEMILANHPYDCLKCAQNKNCELQSLAVKYGVVSSSFKNESGKHEAVIESETIVRDMDKCVKCARCVETCQEVQTIRAINTSNRSHEFEISTAYKQPLEDVSCVFCGQCAKVCPVSAICGNDQSADVWGALNKNCDAKAEGIKTIAQVSPAISSILETAFSLPAGSVTKGKLAALIRLLGFDKVYDASITANITNTGICSEVKQRKNNSGYSLPVISGCSQGVMRFIRNFYPDLESHISIGKNPRKLFASDIKNNYAKEAGLTSSDITSVSFVPCLAQKYAIMSDKKDFALTAEELAKMIRLAGIMIETLPEEQFDTCNLNLSNEQTDQSLIKKETVNGFAKARNAMESIQKNECSADWIELLSCPGSDCPCSNCS